ncbi:MAG: Dabb family protein [Bacteroidetes bacterium]|nr:Dabb family protein [Bacteroidota bacterium]
MKNESRRNFVKTAAAAVAALPLSGAAIVETKPKNMKNIFVHQVYFWLKNPGNGADRAKLVEGLTTLTKIKHIKNWHIGVPAGTSRDVIDGSFDISWLNTLKDRAAQDAYQVDPIHLAFVENYKHLWTKVVVYDSVDV